MPGTVANAYPSNNTQALFQAWTQKVSDGVAAAGLVKTTDTGQTAPSALLAPGVASTSYGYEVYRFADLLQATAPIFVKLTYRSGASISTPALTVTVGTATDGAGNLTSANGSPNTLVLHNVLDGSAGYSNATTVQLPIYTYGPTDGAALGLMVFPTSNNSGNSNYGGGFVVERCRDADGTASGRGLMLTSWQAAASISAVTTNCFIFTFSGTQPAQTTAAYVVHNFAGSAVEGSAVYPYPVFTGLTPRLNAPSKILTLAGRTDVPVTTQYQMTHYGETGTWVSMGGAYTTGATGYGSWTGNTTSGLQSPQMRIA